MVPPPDVANGLVFGRADPLAVLRLQLLARGSEQDLVDVQLVRLADRKGDDPRERIGRTSDLSNVGTVRLLGVRLADLVEKLRPDGPR